MPECERRLSDVLRRQGGDACVKNVLLDVFAPDGRLFGFCVSTEDTHVFIQPDRLRGQRVEAPMRVGPRLNSLSVAVFLTSAVCLELGG